MLPVDSRISSDDDRLVIFEAIAELVRNDELRSELDDLSRKILATPLGKNLMRNLPRAKAVFARTRPCLSEAMRLIVTAQTLSEYVVRDCQ